MPAEYRVGPNLGLILLPVFWYARALMFQRNVGGFVC